MATTAAQPPPPASTPPPPSLRARTPPAPGAHYDAYHPYSPPRRSTRTTAHSNPYSSFNAGDRTTPPPTVVKKARFARATATTNPSPPSSPVSPVKQSLHKPPRKPAYTLTPRAAHSDSSDGGAERTHSLAPHSHSHIDPASMLPTPSKTPLKHKQQKLRKQATTTTPARILHFPPQRLNDAMPSPRKARKHAHAHVQAGASSGFELFEDDFDDAHGAGAEGGEAEGEIEVYTDANARLPVRDEREENPFVGPKKKASPRRRGVGGDAQEEEDEEERIDQAVRREQGVTYVFRGKKIFRPFVSTSNGHADAAEEAEPEDLSDAPSQRRLRHQAGPAAQRPLTRSAIKPRLLFPSEAQRAEREPGRDGDGEVDEVDEEEATTDVDMDVEVGSAHPAAAARGRGEDSSHPAGTEGEALALDRDEVEDEEGDGDATMSSPPKNAPVSASFTSASTAASKHAPLHPTTGRSAGTSTGTASPFDAWPRTKPRKRRAGEGVEGGAAPDADGGVDGGGGKRTRAGAALGKGVVGS